MADEVTTLEEVTTDFTPIGAPEPTEVENIVTDFTPVDEPTFKPKPIPVLREAPDMDAAHRAWGYLRGMFKDPEAESAKATLALVDAQNYGITPSAAYRIQDTIGRGLEFNPKAAMKRSTLMERVQQSWDIGGKQNQVGELGYKFIVTGDPQWLTAANEIGMPSPEEIFVPESRLEEHFRSAAKLLPMTVDIAKEAGWKGIALGTGFGLVATLAGPEAVIPAVYAGIAIGGAEGLFEGALRKEAGLAVMELMELEDEEGNKLDLTIARGAAFGVGVINAGLEVTSVKILMDTIPGLNKLFSRAITETVTSKTVKGQLLELGALYGGTVAKETGIEVAQESTNIVFTELAKNVNNALEGTDISPTDVNTVMERLIATAKESAQGFSVIAAPGVVITGAVRVAEARKIPETIIKDTETLVKATGLEPEVAKTVVEEVTRVRQAEANQEFIEGLSESAEAVGARLLPFRAKEGLTPELRQEYFENLKEESGVENIYIPAEKWETYFQEKELDPVEELRSISPELAEQYAEAIETGADIVIPVEDYVMNIAGTEHHGPLSVNIKLRPEDMTTTEAETLKETAPERIAGLRKVLEREEAVDPVERIIETVSTQLEATGRVSPEDARLQAEALYGTVFRVMGERAGVSPETLFERFGLKIGGPEVILPDEHGITYNQGGEVKAETPEFKAWFGDSKVVDESGEPEVVYHGTTHDIEAFSPDRGNIENDFGVGFYFSNSQEDVAVNYAGEGPDLTQRIVLRKEQLEQDMEDTPEDFGFLPEETIDFEVAAETMARKELSGGAPNTVPVYISMENPVEIGGSEETFFEMEQEVDEEGDFVDEPTGSLVDFIGALRAVVTEFDDHDVEVSIGELLEASNFEFIRAGELIDKLATSEGLQYATNEKGQLASKEIIRQTFERMGFDGLIDNTVNEKFGEARTVGQSMAGIDEDTVHYIAFQPTQIKSIFNRGTFDPTDPRILFQEGVAPTFFSQLETVIQDPKFPSKASGEVMSNIIKKGAVKAEEIKWSGIEDFLKGKKSVTKEEVLEHLRLNRIEIVEDVKGDEYKRPFTDEDQERWRELDREGYDDLAVEEQTEYDELTERKYEESRVKFADYTLPGGENYKEMLLRLPEDIGLTETERKEQIELAKKGEEVTPEELERRLELERLSVAQRRPEFVSTHFDEPNILAHVRFNERTDSEGNKVLFLEEIQSDWAAEGRKKGFAGEADEVLIKERAERQRLLDENLNTLNPRIGALQNKEEREPLTAEEREEVRVLVNKRADNELRIQEIPQPTVVPSSPLLKNWHELALKRMLRYAAENDFDKVAWITGEQTADRYDLSKKIGEINWHKNEAGDGRIRIDALTPDLSSSIINKNMDNSELESAIGKELTQRINEGVGKTSELELPGGGKVERGTLSGLDLKVGGEWAKTLYDKVVPNFLKKYGKKWGAKVEKTAIPSGNDEVGRSTDGRWYLFSDGLMDADQSWATEEEAEEALFPTQQSIDITPEMKKATLEVGQPLFQRKGKAPRGRIFFGPEGVNIDLLKDANPSTFIHETGHFYLRMLGDIANIPGVSQDIINDYETALDFLGLKPGETLTVEQQEKWARAFETYIGEGRAPSVALREAFARFRVWLAEVYKTLRGLNVELTPEVREVMARMVATQEEIDIVQPEFHGAVVDLVTEGKELEKITNADIARLVPAYRGVPTSKVKPMVRRVTGLTEDAKMIREDEALNAAWKKAAQSARKAFKAGKEFETAKWKEKLQEVRIKAHNKVIKIQTDKQKIDKRRRQIKTIVDYLGLTDGQVRKLLSRKNIALMTDWDYKRFKDDLLVRAVEIQDKDFAKARVSGVIQDKRLEKVENYRRALGLPTISKMTTVQLNEWADTLEEFSEGDIFLTQRELETVDRTDLRGIRTWQEARERLAKELGIPIEELPSIQVSWLDKYRFDAALAEANPFYGLLVGETTKQLLNAEARTHEVETKIFELAKKAEKSRKRGIVGRLIPQDEQIMNYLEATEEAKEVITADMTAEQIDLAHYMQEYFGQALEYLIKTKSLEKGRENYFVHMRRSFFETFKDDGLLQAVAGLFKQYQEEEMTFNILDEDTGNILPLEKFFQFSMRRTGAIEPTKNVVKAFLTYAKTFEKKVTLDELIPKLDIYAQSLTPRMHTPRGLEMDRSLKKFVYKWVNNKKGRNIDMGFVKQGDKIDLTIRAFRALTTIVDLGFSLPVGIAAFVGEKVANFEMLGTKGYSRGFARRKTKKGRAILKKHEAFIGRSFWEEFTAPGKEITERLMESAFGLFHLSSVSANKTFLLGSLTKKEYDSGNISEERLAELRIEMGRFRVVPGTKSLVGSTSAGGAFAQYKTWAVPIVRTLSKDITTMVKDLRAKPVGEALTTREAREIYRLIGLTATIIIVLGIGDDEDKSFIGQLKSKAHRESMSLMQGMDPKLWLSVPRVLTFLAKLGNNIHALLVLEEYKSKPGLKGIGGLKQQFTPRVIKQLTKEDPKTRRIQ